MDTTDEVTTAEPDDDRGPVERSSLLAGKVAVISGGASGIGLATARLLKEAGAAVVLFDVDAAAGKSAAGDLGALFVPGDVGEAGDWEEVIATATAELGGVDLGYVNAGVVTSEADITALSDDAYRRIMRVNVDGVVLGIRALVPAIESRGGGAIVATASLAGLISYSPDPIYALTKHAVVGLVRALAPQLLARGITVNAICPGLVDTPLLSPEAKEVVAAAGFPLIPANEIAEAVLGRMIGTESGRAWVCQAGRETVAYRFAGVPGPGGHAAGRTPPPALSAFDQVRPE